MSTTTYGLFAQSAPGLEPLLLSEIVTFFGEEVSAQKKSGGVSLRLGREQLWTLALRTRVAESLRVRLKSFIARDFSALQEGVSRLPWRAFLAPGSCVDARVVCHRSRLWHTGAVTERVLELLERRFGIRPGRASEGANLVHVRITGDAVQVSIDAGGYRLHRRGFRTHVTQASVRETLAAALVAQVFSGASGPVGGQGPVLWDPFCGAGTIGLEALLRGRGHLSGRKRTFAFETWPTHDPEAFAAHRDVLVELEKRQAPSPALRVVLSDRSEEALEAARHNIESAGLSDAVQFFCGEIQDIAPRIPQGTLVASNPPYGKRLREEGALRQLTAVLARRPDLRPCALLIGGAGRKKLSPRFRALLRLRSGGQNVSVRWLDRGQALP